jgi:hypothetical protein
MGEAQRRPRRQPFPDWGVFGEYRPHANPKEHAMTGVKLQILLKQPANAQELEKIERLIGTMGAELTGRGAVTLSAVMPRERFEKVFNKRFEGTSGFVADPGKASVLPVPEALRDHVESISETPVHIPMKE